MPKASVLQSSFSSGEVSPLYYGQADNPRYKKGLQIGQNFIPLLQGPVIRRPGTKFCAKAKFTNAPPVLIPFQFSATQAYMLEFGNQYIRFYANNGQMITVGSSFQITGTTILPTYVDPVRGTIGNFYATRALVQLEANEFAISASVGVAPGAILELKSPYLTADLPQIQWRQTGDTLYLTHPNYPLYKLQRESQTYWKISPVILQDGPYFQLNTYAITGDCANFSLLLSASATTPPGFGTIHTVSVNISGAVTDPAGSGQIQITTAAAHGLLTGQNVWIDGVTGTTEANNWDSVTRPAAARAYWTITVTSTTTFILQGSVFVNAYAGGGASYPALFAQGANALKNSITPVPDVGRTIGFIIGGVRYYGYISTFQNASITTIVWPGVIAVAPTITAWQLGIYSTQSGFPRCLSFHQNRLVLGGAGGSPQGVDGSVVGKYESFAPSSPTTLNVSDDNAFSFQLNSSDSNILQWMFSTAQGLLAGTYVAEWCMTPASVSDALTPTNFNAQQTSFYGASSIPPVQIGNGTLYVQRAARKVREMSFFFSAGTFRSIDLTELSEHLTIPSITRLAVTKEPQPLIWGTRSDGTLVSMIYNRDDVSLIAGWTRHILGGRSDSIGTQPIASSIASIPSPDASFDQLWLVVKRFLNATTAYSIEYMTKPYDDSFLQEDAFQLDCGATFYNPIAISGVTNASPARVTTAVVPTLANGDRVSITGIVGMVGPESINNKQYIIQNLVGSSFDLYDFDGNPISSIAASAYISGGSVSKLVTTISGLDWLENTNVSVLVDGGLQPDVNVNGAGQITLQIPAAKVQIGYAYDSLGQLLRPDAGSPDGTAIGKMRRTHRVSVQMHKTGDLALGTSFDNLIPVELSQADVDQADKAMPLFSGMIREGIESAYDFESQLCFKMSSALPGCIQSITSFMEEFDV